MKLIVKPLAMQKTVKAVEHEPKKKLPVDAYSPEYELNPIHLTDEVEIRMKIIRSGEFGLPYADMRLYVKTSSYTGFTKKGFSLPVAKLHEVRAHIDELMMVSNSRGWMEESQSEHEAPEDEMPE